MCWRTMKCIEGVMTVPVLRLGRSYVQHGAEHEAQRSEGHSLWRLSSGLWRRVACGQNHGRVPAIFDWVMLALLG